MKHIALSVVIATSLATGVASAVVSKDLAYPADNVSAADVANQNYFVNHFYSFDNYGITKKGKEITALILRAQDSNPLTITLERYLNNKPKAAGVNAQDLAVFRSGKLRGTSMLITDFSDQSKSQS